MNQHSCKLCTNEDDEQMVQCDKCDDWYHFICVNVTQEIENQKWSCSKCISLNIVPIEPKAASIYKTKSVSSLSVTSRTSERKRNALIELEKLKEFEELEKQLIANESKKLLIEKANLEEKYRLKKVLEEEEDINESSQISKVNSKTSKVNKNSIENWINNIKHPINIKEKNESASNQFKFEAVNPHLRTDLLVNKNDNKENILNVENTQNYNPTSQNISRRYFLSKENIAARQVMGKDLPYFNGQPCDWPLFISTFERTTNICNFTNDENLIRLSKSLKGEAMQAVRSKLLLPSNVPSVIKTLRDLYGRPEIVINELLRQLRNITNPKEDKFETVIAYSIAVDNLCSIVIASNMTAYLNNPTLLQELIEKLPTRLKYDWAFYKQHINNVNLATFNEWISNVASTINTITLPVNIISKSYNAEIKTNNRRRVNEKYFNNIHIEEKNNKITSDKIDKKCCVCKGNCSSVLQCETFKTYNVGKRWHIIKKFNLCKICLTAHKLNACKSNKVCGKYDCKLLHHELLHWDNNNINKEQNNNNENRKNMPSTSSNTDSSNNLLNKHIVSSHQTDNQTVLYKIIPVVLYGKNKSIKVYAYLDDGSSATLIDQQLCDYLDVNKIPEPMCLKWSDGTRREEEKSHTCNIQISSVDNLNKIYNLNRVHTVKILDLPTQTVNMKILTEHYSYLKNIPINSYEKQIPRILIGLKQSKLVCALKTRVGGWQDPVATKTRLGWTVHGNCKKFNNDYSPEVHNVHQCECVVKQNEELHTLVKEHFALENIGVIKNSQLESNDIQKARRILEETTKRIGNRFEVGLLWKYEKFILPKSIEMAKHRFMCLEKKMERDPDIARNLRDQISEYKSKDYIRKLSAEDLKKHYDRIWYLPVFPIINKSKPGKVRMVWDAAAISNGISLNSMLLKGPDELNLLINVLFQFRERKVAICGDIKQMFHQVRIKLEDQQVQRFFWRDEKTLKLDTYVMQVMTFGATCSPSCAQFIKNKNADEHKEQYPKASHVIKNNHYVDDFLYSLDSENEAIQLAKEVKIVHEKAGFEIGKWLSNSIIVMNNLGEKIKSGSKNMNMTPEELSDKVLGMWWNRENDTFTYSLRYNKTNKDILYGKCRPTKREVLRTLMSVFDPLGLIAHFMIYLKILLQDVWRSALDWDHQISEQQYQEWLNWLKVLPKVENLKIPRCYLQQYKFSDIDVDVQLHVFVDASEKAYATVAYLRVVTKTHIECTIVGAKTRVTPLKPISIPRLELEAAVLGSRFSKAICNGLSIKISKKVFWTDSKTVMCWLHSDQRKYKQFVAFRIGEILENTNLNEWRWIPSKENVADEATKWNVIPNLTYESRWFQGPNFLKLNENSWPENISVESIKSTNEEMRINVHEIVIKNDLIDSKRFSKWNYLLRTQAYVFRFINNISSKRTSSNKIFGPFTQEEYIQAANQLYRQAQLETYTDEIKNLKSENTKNIIDKKSRIYKLSPYLDNDKVLRVRGRIDLSTDVEFETKRPIILPHEHNITKLLIDHYHRKYHHHNSETVVNEIRQKYSISRLRSAVKKAQQLCQHCKNKNASPKPPEMSDLPSARLQTFTRPFSYAGIDYFGPMLITHGRNTEKRWGVLVTCLTTRAVHIEVAYNLTTDSCILAIRKFIARRGQPNELYSDNGTNFHGAENELKKAFQNINKNKLIEEFTDSNMKWIFIPPAAPHMGGCWERLVRSVKKTLYSIMPTRNPSDELLYGMLVEVENIINSRPLTRIPLENENNEAITPNHFLLGTSNGAKPIGEFNAESKILRQNWMKSQQYANLFWKRWIKEYLPNLTRRAKWYDPVKPIEKGDIVIIVDENNPRNNWPKGKILETCPGKDGNVRRAIVQTATGIYERPAVKLAVLDVKPQNIGKLTEEINIPGGSVASPTF